MPRTSPLEMIDGALRDTAKPYGFTVTVWTAGAILISSHGQPGVDHAVLFAAGAVTAFGLLRVASAGHEFEGETDLTSQRGAFLRAGAIHVGAMTAGVGAAALVALIGAGVAWPLGSFAATLAYLLVTAAGLSL